MQTASLHTYSIGQLLNLLTGQVVPDYAFYLGYFTADSKILAYPYRIQGYAIGVLTSGWLTGSLNLETFQVNRGQVMIIAPHQIHSIQSCSADFAMRTLFFTDFFLTDILRQSTQVALLSLFQPHAPAVLSLSETEWHRISAGVDLIERHYWPVDQASQLPIRYILQALVTDLNQIFEKSTPFTASKQSMNRPSELTRQFRQLVTQHYLTKRKISDYADLLAISTKHLSETVKQQTGQPASAWIDAMMVQEAQVLLSQTTNSIAEIAYYLNFSSQSSFGKFFRSKVGITPVTYRRIRRSDAIL
ncbi:helix-turn-helix domain-containing protein [Larkinella harenae]